MNEKYNDHSKRNPFVFKYQKIDDEEKSGFYNFDVLKLSSKFKNNLKHDEIELLIETIEKCQTIMKK